jgi:Uma2 family endonuclease
MSTTLVPPLQEIDYPERDGKPLGETDVHRREIAQIIEMLEEYYRANADVYISGNLMFYYEEGNPRAVVSPDVFVVKGVPKKLRRTYKLWEERQAPVTVFEITSRSTRKEDKVQKRALYAMMGVREYFMFDPLSEYLKPPLQGFRLVGEEYVSIKPEADGALISTELGLRMYRDDAYLRLIELSTGQPLLRASELNDARRAAEERAQVAEEELERLRAEIARLRGEQP